MSILKFTATSIVLAILSTQVFASERSPNPDLLAVATDAIASQEAALREIALERAPIRSAEDLAAYLRQDSSTRAGDPLSVLARTSKIRFLRSLVFTDRGLASFSYYELQDLTTSQAYDVLSLFGAQYTTAIIPGLIVESSLDAKIISEREASLAPLTDYPDYECLGTATCGTSMGRICIGQNCIWQEP